MIIFYNPQSSAARKPVLPMSLLAVGAVLEGRYDYSIVDGNLDDTPLETLARLLAGAGPTPLLCVTVMPGPQLQQAVPLCRRLREMHPNLRIVWGGYFPTQHWDVCLRAPYVDYVVRGHGELAFLQLLEWLEGERESGLASIPGIAYRDESGEPVSNPLAPIPHPRQLPGWNFERVPVARYLRRTFLGRRTLGYHSSYGCPFFCNFCAVVNMVNGRWLAQSAEQVAGVARLYRERWSVDAIEFYDNNFFTHEARTAEFSERIGRLGLAWWGEGRIDTLEHYTDDTWRLMRDSGLHMIFMGAESGSAETLKRMHKGGQMHPDRTLAMAARMRQWGITPEFSFVLGNPPHPEADALETMAFIRQVKKINPEAEIIMYLYTPVPLAGDLYDDALASGFAFPDSLDAWIGAEWADFAQRRSDTMPWIQQTLREQIRDFERVLNAYYPTSTNPRLTGTRRGLLRAASGWRYHTGFYRFPLELRALHRLLAYQRPETSGF
jgi:anaerobic magnesium-protoporphyrin IX monomethyl ester cyclase